jgi:hypothetical protein
MTRILLICALVGAVGCSVFAQTANVIELEPADTARAQKAWDELQKAKNHWALVIADINMRYLNASRTCPAGNTCAVFNKEGFEAGFEFNKDFKFIVPKIEPSPTPHYQLQPYGQLYNYN